jgi:hypothetical protein
MAVIVTVNYFVMKVFSVKLNDMAFQKKLTTGVGRNMCRGDNY